MAIKMIGLDLDGTLFDPQKRLTERTRSVLRQAIEAGIVIVPATGRPRVGVPKVLTQMQGIRYCVVTNGAGIYDLRENVCLHEVAIERETAARFLERTRSLRSAQGAFIGEWGYMEPCDRERIEQLPLVEEMKAYLIGSRRIVESLPEFVRRQEKGPQKLVLMFLPAQADGVTDRLAAEEIVGTFERLTCVSGGVENIEIMDRRAGKGAALLRLGEMLGIRREEIMAVGDSENDLDMIEKAGLGVAMGNSEAVLLSHADAVTGTNEEDGAAAAIARYALTCRLE